MYLGQACMISNMAQRPNVRVSYYQCKLRTDDVVTSYSVPRGGGGVHLLCVSIGG